MNWTCCTGPFAVVLVGNHLIKLSVIERQVERSHEERTHSRTETISRYLYPFIAFACHFSVPIITFFSWLV